ncbi:MAG: hypothetical protein KBT83_10875 [Marinobacter sp.]|nr:hypothetical protein [Marinobacter sp.]
MKQSLREDVDLALASGATKTRLATGFIKIGGRIAREAVEGGILEACVQQGEHYLVFLTDDIPYEDSLHIHLLDSDLSSQDSVTLGAAYTTGNFRNLVLGKGGTLTFEFFGNKSWAVSVLSEKRLRIPYLSGPPGVSWSKGFFHQLDLRSACNSVTED